VNPTENIPDRQQKLVKLQLDQQQQLATIHQQKENELQVRLYQDLQQLICKKKAVTSEKEQKEIDEKYQLLLKQQQHDAQRLETQHKIEQRQLQQQQHRHMKQFMGHEKPQPPPTNVPLTQPLVVPFVPQIQLVSQRPQLPPQLLPQPPQPQTIPQLAAKRSGSLSEAKKASEQAPKRRKTTNKFFSNEHEREASLIRIAHSLIEEGLKPQQNSVFINL